MEFRVDRTDGSGRRKSQEAGRCGGGKPQIHTSTLFPELTPPGLFLQ